MAARLLLGVIAALRAVLIPGEAGVLMTEPLAWPKWALPSLLPSPLRAPAERRAADGAPAA
jgi:hypothetical protein